MRNRRVSAQFAAALLAFALPSALPAFLRAQQSESQHHPAKTAAAHGNPAQAEMTRRILAADAARNAGDPASIAAANKRLIALALREMGQLRMTEMLYAQAGEFYKSSLEFENSIDTRSDLAMSEVLAEHPDDAIQQAQQVLAAEPRSARAYETLGRAYIQKQDYPKAEEALGRAAQLQPDIDTLYSLAICWLSTNNVQGKEHANAVFAQMKEMAGDSGSLHVLFGRAYRDAGMMPEAIREFQRAIQLDPATPHVHYFLGLARLSLNEWKPTPEAQSEIAEELRYHPDDFLANYMSGFLASSERQYAVAEKYLKVAAQLNPSWPEPWLFMGLNAYAQGDRKAAETQLRKAIELTGQDESRSNYQIRRAYVDMARILASSGREQESDLYTAKARDLQNKVMQESQQATTSMMLSRGASASMAGLVPLDKQRESQAASLGQRSADEFAPVDASVLAKANLTEEQRATVKTQEDALRLILAQSFADLATAEAIQHDYATALTHYQDAEHWNPAIPDLAKNLGQCAFRVQNYPEAIRGLSSALKDQPESLPLRAMLGMAYFATEKYGDAATTFYPLGFAGMKDSTVGYAWAASLAKTGDLKDASQVLEQYQSGNRSNDTLLQVGQLWTEIGDYHRATDTFHQVLENNPSMPKAHYYAGLADIFQEHWSDARTEFQAELALHPQDPDALYHLGFVDLEESKLDAAAKLFEQVVAAHPDYANAQYELGKILLDRGDLHAAVPHLEAAARLTPEKDYIHYQLQAAYRKESRIADADRELAVYQQLKAKSRPHLPQASTQNP